MTGESKHNLRSGSNTNKSSAQPTKKTTSTKPSTTVNASRLSTSTTSSRNSTPAAKNLLSETVRSQETRISALEVLVSQLVSVNSDLRQTISNLQTEVTQCKNLIQQHQSSVIASENNISLDQQDLNTNIVIRGVDVKEDTPESELLSVYEGLRSHLKISGEADLAPVSVAILSSNPAKVNISSRPIRVQLPSVTAKAKFLQVRRVKKDIFLSDIGINNGSRRHVLISEQLTRTNQELLYQARSLRGQNKFKFVWSSNGQILARQRENSKVIRIADTAHVNRLREELNLEPLTEYGRRHTATTVQHDSSHS